MKKSKSIVFILIITIKNAIEELNSDNKLIKELNLKR